MDKKTFSLICAIITSILWGSAFVAQDMGMDFIGPHTFNVGRFLIGFLTLLPFFFIFELKNINFKRLDKKQIAYFLFYLGFVLAVGQELQQISLIYTDVANTGVFTVFYVLVVPVISYFIFSKKILTSGRKIIGFDLSETGTSKNGWDENVGARVLFKMCNLMLSDN